MKECLLALCLLISGSASAAATGCEALIQPLPRYAQKSDFTCGAVCVRSVFEYLTGIHFTEQQMGYMLGTYQRGYTDPYAIIRFFGAYGIRARLEFGKQLADLRDYMRAGESLIVSITLEGTPHYAAVTEIGPDHVTLMDPWIVREGREQKLTLEQFDRMWTINYNQANLRGSVLRVAR